MGNEKISLEAIDSEKFRYSGKSYSDKTLSSSNCTRRQVGLRSKLPLDGLNDTVRISLGMIGK